MVVPKQELPSVVEVVDKDGIHHWGSPLTRTFSDGLRDGSLRLAEEVAREAKNAAVGDDPDAGSTDAGSGVRQRGSRSSSGSSE